MAPKTQQVKTLCSLVIRSTFCCLFWRRSKVTQWALPSPPPFLPCTSTYYSKSQQVVCREECNVLKRVLLVGFISDQNDAPYPDSAKTQTFWNHNCFSWGSKNRIWVLADQNNPAKLAFHLQGLSPCFPPPPKMCLQRHLKLVPELANKTCSGCEELCMQCSLLSYLKWDSLRHRTTLRQGPCS